MIDPHTIGTLSNEELANSFFSLKSNIEKTEIRQSFSDLEKRYICKIQLRIVKNEMKKRGLKKKKAKKLCYM